jgi:hypothetical protein
MKHRLIKIVVSFAACLGLNWASHALAQTEAGNQAGSANAYGNVKWSQISSNELTSIVKSADPSKIPTNAWGIILKRVDWFQLPTNVQYYVSDNVDWSLVPTNIIEYYNQPKAWVNSAQALKQGAETMRSSIDKAWLAMITDKLTNQPTVLSFTNRSKEGVETVMLVTNSQLIHYLRDFAERLELSLVENAGYLTNPRLNAYHGVSGYGANIKSPTVSNETTYFGFRDERGLINDYRQLADGVSRARVKAIFDENGKLGSFEVFTAEHKDAARFAKNGRLQQITWDISDGFAIRISCDDSGSAHITGYFVTIPPRRPLTR